MSRDIADGETDAAVIGAIRLRSVKQQHMVQRRLARLQLHIDGLGLVDIDRDLLATGKQVVLVECVLVLDLALVGSGDEFHAAGYLVGRRHRDPCGRDIGRTEAPIGGILMPGDEAGIAGLLDKEAGVPAKDIRPEHILDRIQDFRMACHLVDPGEENVAAMAHLGLDRTAAAGLIILQLVTKIGNFARAQRIDRKMVATIVIGRDLILAQQFWHGFPPNLLLFFYRWPMAFNQA